MSFILDALKKSEAERQRKSVPGFADIPDGRDATAPQRWWWWALGSLLAVNLGVLLGVFFRPGATETVAPAIASEAVTAPADPRGERPVAELVSEARQASADREAATITEVPRRPAAQPTIRQQEPAPAPVLPRRGTTTLGEALPTLEEVRAEGLLQLPNLHLDIHVYSERAAERFVFINMSRYNENAVLAEGPVVKEIMPEGVLLEHSGTRFLLPRR
ncbi:MAG: general secretion pathway protein GspB [Woeseia sp.]